MLVLIRGFLLYLKACLKNLGLFKVITIQNKTLIFGLG